MLKSRVSAGSSLVCALTLLAASPPAVAGTLYVPLPVDDGTTYHTEVAVANTSSAVRRFSTLFIETGADGTAGRGADPAQLGVSGRSTLLLTNLAPAGKTGLLELTGAPQLDVSARLIAGAPAGPTGAGADLPVLTSENVFAAGSAIDLHGLRRDAQHTTTQVLVNLGHQPAACAVATWRANGTAIGATAEFTLPPLSQRVTADVLGGLGETLISLARATVACSQKFYAFALVLDAETPEATIISPAASLASTLPLPTDEPGGCPAGATCFALEGDFFTPTKSEPYRIYKVPVPAGQKFRRLETTFRFRHGGWNDDPASIFTLIYINRNGKFRANSYGVIDIAAGDARRVHLELTADLPATGPPAGVQNERQKVDLVPGETYDVHWVYDAENLKFALTFVDSAGVQVVNLTGSTRSTTRHIESKGSFWIQFSEPFLEGTIHVPSLGWTHSDLLFALVP